MNNWGVVVLAVLVIGIIGAFALLYPATPSGELALGALLPIAGAIGAYFFHSSAQGFLGAQLAAQRVAFLSQIPGLQLMGSDSRATTGAGGTSSVGSPALKSETTSTPQGG